MGHEEEKEEARCDEESVITEGAPCRCENDGQQGKANREAFICLRLIYIILNL